jgi:hypothetical protein
MSVDDRRRVVEARRTVDHGERPDDPPDPPEVAQLRGERHEDLQPGQPSCIPRRVEIESRDRRYRIVWPAIVWPAIMLQQGDGAWGAYEYGMPGVLCDQWPGVSVGRGHRGC